jgi:hypothetical protein
MVVFVFGFLCWWEVEVTTGTEISIKRLLLSWGFGTRNRCHWVMIPWWGRVRSRLRLGRGRCVWGIKDYIRTLVV